MGLLHKIKHYYEVDLDNCAMTQDDWIIELANAMVDPDYYQKFMREYNEYLKERKS